MYLGCDDADAELLRRAQLFAGLRDDDQARLVRLMLYNDLRGSNTAAAYARALNADPILAGTAGNLSQVIDAVENLLPLSGGLVTDLAADLRGRLHRQPELWLSTSAEVLATLARSTSGPWFLSASFTTCFALAGLVPCPAFAFGRWHLAPGVVADESQVRNLVELACCYAYRLAGLRQPARHGAVIGSGAYSISTRQGHLLTKSAINLGARDFMLEQEARLLRRAARLPMAGRLPQFESWDAATAELRREYIPGSTGHDLLVSGAFPQQHYVDDLAKAHDLLADGLRELRVSLDLHPGNFVWHNHRQQWVLVDAGPVPTIGADYYDLDSFDDYWQAVWLRRLDNMRDIPVRSLEWEPLLTRS